MTTKKIWVFAIIFGMFMSGLFYLWTSSADNQPNTVTVSEDETKKTEAVKEAPKDALEIDSGKRAISLAVSEVESVSGFIKPGSYVDAIAILPAAAGEESSSQILLTNIKVLATGNSLLTETSETQTTTYQMVTLEVTPAEGATLAFAKETGVVTLMLKGSQDHEEAPKINIPLQQLKKGEMPK